jgi:WD40 repeat protein
MWRRCIGLGLVAVVSSALADHAITPHPKILWNVKPYPTPPETFPQTIAVSAVELTPDGEKIVTAGYNGEIKFLNRSNGAVARTILAHSGAVNCLGISKDGQLLVSGGADRFLNLWRISDAVLLRSFQAHTTAVYSVALSPDASLMISGGGRDNRLNIWRTSDGRLARSLQGTWSQTAEDFGGMRSVAFAPNGQYVAGSGLEVWRVDGTVVRPARNVHVEARTQVKFTADSTRIFGTVAYGIQGYAIADETMFQPRSTSYFPQSAISPDGASLISTSPGSASSIFPSFVWALIPASAWRLERNEGVIESYICADGDCSLTLSSLAFDPRMRSVAAGTASGEVMLLELPIWISGVQRNGNQVDLQWQGGNGNYQVEKRTLPGVWQDVGGVVSSNAASVSVEGSNAVLRVRNVGP